MFRSLHGNSTSDTISEGKDRPASLRPLAGGSCKIRIDPHSSKRLMVSLGWPSTNKSLF